MDHKAIGTLECAYCSPAFQTRVAVDMMHSYTTYPTKITPEHLLRDAATFFVIETVKSDFQIHWIERTYCMRRDVGLLFRLLVRDLATEGVLQSSTHV